jgi:hypothetical protein
MLSPVLVSVCLEKRGMLFLPAGQFQSCLHKPAHPTGEQHIPHVTPLSTPQGHNPAQPMGSFKTPTPSLNKTQKHKQWIVIYTNSGVRVESWTCLGEWGGQVTKAESRDRVTNQFPRRAELAESRGGINHKGRELGWDDKPTPQSMPWWIFELASEDWGWHSKLNCTTLLGEKLTRQSFR